MPAHTITWSHGSARVSTTAAMLCDASLLLGDRTLSPFARAPWADDAAVASLEGHLRVLGGEFVGLPFGSSGAPAVPAPEWIEHFAAAPAPTPSPQHGPAADAEWDVVSLSDDAIVLRLEYPGDSDIAWVERSIRGRAGAPGLDFGLRVGARRDTRTPVGLHPIVRLPDAPGGLELDVAFAAGFTYPGHGAVATSALADWSRFSSLSAVPGVDGRDRDLSRLPWDAPMEEVVLLTGVDGPVVVTWPAESARLTLDWDRALLPSLQVWASDRVLDGGPWNRRYRGLGLEPVAAAFDLAPATSTASNPLTARGVATAVELTAGEPLVTSYSIVASTPGENT